MNNATTVIDAKKISKSFLGKPAVVDFGLNLKQGEICGFLGPNGSGKTTTLRMLCGLLTPDTGSGHCLGFDLIKDAYEIKKHVGYMTQQFSLYTDMTAYENLDFMARAYQIKNRKAKINEYIQLFNLGELKNKLAGHLSGGMKQRLALAGCLLHDPKLLLLDEPTAGVDPKVRREFWDELYTLSKQGITTLVSTHYMDEAERCTRLVYIAYGHLIAQGTASEIMNASKLITWSIEGNNLHRLADRLNEIDGVEQIAFFGQKLHICGKNRSLLQNIHANYSKDYRWTEQPPSLEDAFISLVQEADNAP